MRGFTAWQFKWEERVAQTKRVSEWSCDAYDAWMKPLKGGDLAVVLWNRGTCGTHRQLTVRWSELALPAGQKMAARDLFQQKDLGTVTDALSGWVNPDGVLMVRLTKAE